MRNIVIPVPDDYDVESVTVTFKRPPVIESGDKPKASKKAKKEEKHQWSDEDIAYLIKNEGTFEEQAAHLGVSMASLYTKRFALREKRLLKDSPAQPKGILLAAPSLSLEDQQFIDGRQISLTKIEDAHHPQIKVLEPEPKVSFWDGLKDKIQGFHAPTDFDPSKPFGVKSYVYLAAGRKVGRVITINQEKDLVTVDFPDQTLQFTIDGARAMHKEMIARAK